MVNINYSVVVVGCQKHEEIAKRYFDLTTLYWKDSLNKTTFCTDKLTNFQKQFCRNSSVCEGIENFAMRILLSLNKVETQFVILLLDDYFITEKVNEKELQTIIAYMNDNNFDYCKLIGLPKCFNKNKGLKDSYHIKKTTHYGVSLQPSIWKKQALIDALSVSTLNSAWEVEVALSNYQANYYYKCITFNKNVLHYKNGVLRGKLFPYTNRLLKKNDIEPLNIETISFIRYFTFSLKQHLSMHLPIWFRKLAKKVGSKAGKKYYSQD